jgi:methionyl-tRNA formyltransferase
LVKCKEGVLLVETVRPAGKSLMPAFAYINGKKYQEGNIIFK